jgi:pyrophosphatase PpaX
MGRGHSQIGSLSAVLFDLDDTLLDSLEARVKALEAVLASAGIFQITARQFLQSLKGAQLKEALSQHEATKEVAADLFEDYRRAYWTKERSTIRLYPGVKSVLKELHSRGVKLGVVTQKGREFEVDGYPAGATNELEELGILHLFSVIVGFEDMLYTKPHPEGVNIALSRLAVSPEKTLVVGDSPADVVAALAAGCWSCLATWGISTPENIVLEAQPHLVAETPEVLLRLAFG